MKVGDLVRFEGANVFSPALREINKTNLVGIVVNIFPHPRRQRSRRAIMLAEVIWPSGSVTRMRADIFKTISTTK